MNEDEPVLPSIVEETPAVKSWAESDVKGWSSGVVRAREEGYTCLSPLERQVAFEFVFQGSTIRRLAKVMGMTTAEANRILSNPIVRAFIADLQKEIAAQRILTDSYVEQSILNLLPKLLGEEPVAVVTARGEQLMRKKFHGAELVSIYKHFAGGVDSSKVSGNAVQINIDMGTWRDVINGKE